MKTCKRGLHDYEGRHCKECQGARHREWLAENQERVRLKTNAWRLRKGEALKAKARARAAAWQKQNPDRARARCAQWHRDNRARALAAQRARYAAKRDSILAASAKWRSANSVRKKAVDKARYRRKMQSEPEKMRQRSAEIQRRRRARKLAATVSVISIRQLDAILQQQGGLCFYCKLPLDGRKHLDHRTPLARGGAHVLANLCWACPDCNLSKNAKTDGEFIALRAACA